jgi:hypothetical protein
MNRHTYKVRVRTRRGVIAEIVNASDATAAASIAVARQSDRCSTIASISIIG